MRGWVVGEGWRWRGWVGTAANQSHEWLQRKGNNKEARITGWWWDRRLEKVCMKEEREEEKSRGNKGRDGETETKGKAVRQKWRQVEISWVIPSWTPWIYLHSTHVLTTYPAFLPEIPWVGLTAESLTQWMAMKEEPYFEDSWASASIF